MSHPSLIEEGLRVVETLKRRDEMHTQAFARKIYSMKKALHRLFLLKYTFQTRKKETFSSTFSFFLKMRI